MTSFRYRRSPRELILIAGSFPFLPQRLIVKGETRRSSATSRMVKRSGKSPSDGLTMLLPVIDIDCNYTTLFYVCQIVELGLTARLARVPMRC